MTKFGTRKKTAFAFWGAAFVLLIAIVFTACPNNSSGGTSEPIPPLALNEETFTKNEWEEFTYQLVTAGSGNYDAEPENPDIIKLYKVNLDSRGEIRIRCKNAGETRIKVTDMASGQTAFSGLITVKTSVDIPDYFEEDGGTGLYVNPFIKQRFGTFSEDGVKTRLDSFILGVGAGYQWNLDDTFIIAPFANIARNFGKQVNENKKFWAIEPNFGIKIGYKF